MTSRKVSVMGDSISTFRGIIPIENRWFYDEDDTFGAGLSNVKDTWWMRLINDHDDEFLANSSFSGSMVQGWDFPAGESKTRAKQLLGEDGETPDIVLVYYGLNDFGWGSPKMQAAAGTTASPANFDASKRSLVECIDIDNETAPEGATSIIPSDKFSDTDPKEMVEDGALDDFKRSYEHMLQNIHEVAPSAQIVCITIIPGIVKGDGEYCYNLRGISMDEYNEAIRESARSQGATIADITAYGKAYDSNDSGHPTSKGMEQLASLIKAALGDEEAAKLIDAIDDAPSGIDVPIEDPNLTNPLRDDGWDLVTKRTV